MVSPATEPPAAEDGARRWLLLPYGHPAPACVGGFCSEGISDPRAATPAFSPALMANACKQEALQRALNTGFATAI